MIFIVITSSCANESCRSRFLCGIVGLHWINGFMGWILSFLPGLREWRARKKILRRHRRDSGLIVSIKLGWSGSGNAIFIILRISEPEDYVVQIRTDPGNVVKCESLIDDSIHADRPSARRIRGEVPDILNRAEGRHRHVGQEDRKGRIGPQALGLQIQGIHTANVLPRKDGNGRRRVRQAGCDRI